MAWDTTPSHTGRRRIEQILDKSKGSTTGNANGNTGGSTSSSKSDGEGSSKDKEVVVQMIDTYEEALDFAQLYWNKIRRDDGRSLQCQAWGSCKWLAGEWCKVDLPSFRIDEYMYITEVSEDNDGGDWTASLTLVDFPPGWGKYEEPEQEDEEEEDTDTDADDTDTDTNDDTTTTDE